MTEIGLGASKLFTAQRLLSMRNDILLFDAEHQRWLQCEKADSELDRDKRTDLRRRVVDSALLWQAPNATPAEIDLLYGMARESARIALARRSASFQREYGIGLTCGSDAGSAS